MKTMRTLYRAKYNKSTQKWSLIGAAGGRYVLEFEQALVKCPRTPLGTGFTIRAIHGLVIPPQAEEHLRPSELRELGVHTPALGGVGKGAAGQLWRLMPDGSVEKFTQQD